MKRTAIYLASAALGAALVASSPAAAAEVSCWYNGGLHPCVWYPGYAYAYPPGYGLGVATAPLAFATEAPAPMMTGRSVAVFPAASSPLPGGGAGPGDYCATSVKTCRLYSRVGLGRAAPARSTAAARGDLLNRVRQR